MRRAVRSAPPLAGLVVVSVVALGALVAARQLPSGAAPRVSAKPVAPTPSTAGTDAARTRPPVNGSARPPLPATVQQAVDRLAATSQPSTGGHVHAGGHLFGPAPEPSLSPSDTAALAGQWAAAQAAVPSLDTTEKAAAAGYVLSSTPAPGVGVHWVNWQLIAQPFDPARPAMLLFSPGPNPRLVGFSYWVQGASPPDGFAGADDQWHTHAGLCVVNGWVEREEVAAPADCPGSWLAGGDLWMLHAWVVPGYANRWGRFAQTNPMLCPSGRVSDLASCRPDLGQAGGSV